MSIVYLRKETNHLYSCNQMFVNIKFSSLAKNLIPILILLFSLTVATVSVYAEDTDPKDASGVQPICDPETDPKCADPAAPVCNTNADGTVTCEVAENPVECGSGSGAGKCDLYTKYINPIIDFLAAVVGIAVTIGIVSGGVRYSAAGSDPGAVAKARAQIRNSIIALVVFLFLWAILNWLQPGGLQ